MNEFDFGKIPPQAIDLEVAVLGAILLEKNAIEKVINTLKPETFYDERHQEVYKAITRLYNKKSPIDLLTVVQELKDSNKLDIVGGIVYVVTLTDRVSSAANTEYHSRIIIQKYLLRELIKIGSNVASECFNDGTDPFDVIDRLADDLIELKKEALSQHDKSIETPFSQMLTETVFELENQKEGELIGITTGSEKIDNASGGFINSELTILAARPAMGKTARLLMHARAAAKAGKKVLIFSLEMSRKQLVKRLISAEGKIHNKNIRHAKLTASDWEAINKAVNEMIDFNIFIVDKAALKISEIASISKIMKLKHGIDLIGIDYLQLAKGSKNNYQSTTQEVTEISAGLKMIAKDLDVPVIALSQLSRKLEDRPNKRPMMADLRDSGSIEQDADNVFAIYRPSVYYGTMDRDSDYNGSCGDFYLKKNNITPENYKEVSEYLFLKFRDGDNMNVIQEQFLGQFSTFQDFKEAEFIADYQPKIEFNEDTPF